MAKARVIDDADDALQGQAEELAQLNEDEGGEIFRAIDELRSVAGTSVIVVRLNGTSEDRGYVGSYPIAEFSHEWLKETCGAGSYKIRIKGPKGFLPGGGTVHISTIGIRAAAPEPKEAGNDFTNYLQLMEQRDAERRRESSERTDRLLSLCIPIAGTIITAMIGRDKGPDLLTLATALKPAPGPSLAEVTQTMANLQAMNKQPTETADPFDRALKIMEAMKEYGSSEKGETSWIDLVRDVVKEGAPMVGPVLQNLAAMRQAQARQNMAPSQPTVRVQPVPEPVRVAVPPTPVSTIVESAESISVGNAAEESEGAKMWALYKPVVLPYLKQIATWAEEDKNPQTYAEVFLDSLPSNIGNYIPQPQALEYLNHPEWWQFVTREEPRFTANLRGWAEEFRLELIDMISVEIPTEPQKTQSGENVGS